MSQLDIFAVAAHKARNVEVAETSREAYRDLKASGALGEAQRAVVNALREHGPMTGAELDRALGSASAHKRTSELARKGHIRCVGRKVCTVTGRSVDAWAVTP